MAYHPDPVSAHHDEQQFNKNQHGWVSSRPASDANCKLGIDSNKHVA